MKICYLANANSIHTVRIVNGMIIRGHQVYLITIGNDISPDIYPEVNIIKLKFPTPFGYYLNYCQARSIIRKLQPDILHTHYASGYGTLSRFINFKPTILSVWGSDIYLYPYRNNFNMWNIKRNLQSADLIGSTSNDMKREIEKFLYAKKEVLVTPFGIDITKFKPNKTNKDRITIGTVKNMSSVYGIDYLLSAFKILKDNVPKEIELEFLLVGGGNVDYYKSMAEKLGIGDITTFTGQISHNEVPRYLNKFDIYCAPSLSESFGVAVLEASACELPVVTSNVGGLPEVVIQNKTGFLVPPKNEIILAEKILELILDENKRKEFGKNGRRFVEENYDWEKNVDMMEKVYYKLLKKENLK